MSEHKQSHAGRFTSWVAVSVIFAGFLVGGYALTAGPNWTLFWVGGLGLCAIGGILALVFNVYGDVVLDKPRVTPTQPIKSR